jgi:hypothetical protein
MKLIGHIWHMAMIKAAATIRYLIGMEGEDLFPRL